MAGVMLGGGFKPISRIKLKMDVAMAMAILGFPPSQAFEHTELIDVERQFMVKIHQIELEKFENSIVQPSNVRTRGKKTKQATIFFKKKVDARKLNEAFQFLIQKIKVKILVFFQSKYKGRIICPEIVLLLKEKLIIKYI